MPVPDGDLARLGCPSSPAHCHWQQPHPVKPEEEGHTPHSSHLCLVSFPYRPSILPSLPFLPSSPSFLLLCHTQRTLPGSPHPLPSFSGVSRDSPFPSSLPSFLRFARPAECSPQAASHSIPAQDRHCHCVTVSLCPALPGHTPALPRRSCVGAEGAIFIGLSHRLQLPGCLLQ